MINLLQGKVISLKESLITLNVQGVGFACTVPHVYGFDIHKEVTLFIHMHWNAENGPSLFGFKTEEEKILFVLIIDCPGIGPKIGLAILSQMSVQDTIQAILQDNVKKLSDINGIGEKKAEQLIVHLKRKVTKLMEKGELNLSAQESQEWYTLTQALESLGYSRQEIKGAIAHLSSTENSTMLPFDQLMRRALGFLSRN